MTCVGKDRLHIWCRRQEGASRKRQPAVFAVTRNKDIVHLAFFISLERITSSMLKLHKRQRQNINYIHHSAVWGEWRTFQFYFPIHCYACLDLLLLSFVPICGICYSHHRSHPSADPERYFLEKHFTHMPMFLLSPTLFLLLFIFVFSLSQTFCSFRFLFCFLLSLFVLLLSLGGLFTGVLETLYCRVNGCLSALRSGWVAWLAWWLQTKVSTSENSEDWWVRQKTKTRWDCKTPATKQTAAHAAAKPSNSVVRLHK